MKKLTFRNRTVNFDEISEIKAIESNPKKRSRKAGVTKKASIRFIGKDNNHFEDLALKEQKMIKVSKWSNVSSQLKVRSKKAWNSATNILLCSFDSGSDIWASYGHYR